MILAKKITVWICPRPFKYQLKIWGFSSPVFLQLWWPPCLAATSWEEEWFVSRMLQVADSCTVQLYNCTVVYMTTVLYSTSVLYCTVVCQQDAPGSIQMYSTTVQLYGGVQYNCTVQWFVGRRLQVADINLMIKSACSHLHTNTLLHSHLLTPRVKPTNTKKFDHAYVKWQTN